MLADLGRSLLILKVSQVPTSARHVPWLGMVIPPSMGSWTHWLTYPLLGSMTFPLWVSNPPQLTPSLLMLGVPPTNIWGNQPMASRQRELMLCQTGRVGCNFASESQNDSCHSFFHQCIKKHKIKQMQIFFAYFSNSQRVRAPYRASTSTLLKTYLDVTWSRPTSFFNSKKSRHSSWCHRWSRCSCCSRWLEFGREPRTHRGPQGELHRCLFHLNMESKRTPTTWNRNKIEQNHSFYRNESLWFWYNVIVI